MSIGTLPSVTQRLAQRELISSDEHQLAVQANFAAQGGGISIGYEQEITHSAAADIPGYLGTRAEIYNIYAQLGDLGFGYDSDELYEIKSPPANHPLALTIAHRGLVRAGLVPRSTQGLITEHVSIGVALTSDNDLELANYVKHLRLTEMLGTTSPERLAETNDCALSRPGFKPIHSWNTRGQLGVKVGGGVNSPEDWHNVNGFHRDRLEYRTLQYQNTKQMQIGLEALYYLSRGFFELHAEPLKNEHQDMMDWFDNYQADVGLPGQAGLDYMYPQHDNLATRRYMQAYASHLMCADLAPVQERFAEYALNAREECGLSRFPSVFDQAALSSLIFGSGLALLDIVN